MQHDTYLHRGERERESIQREQRGEKREGEEREEVKLVLNCGNWRGRKREEDLERKWRGVVVIMFRVLRAVDGSIQSRLALFNAQTVASPPGLDGGIAQCLMSSKHVH